MIVKTKSGLLTKGVDSSDLGINFRNSNEIFETSTNISKDQSFAGTTAEVQQVLDVTKKGSTISSSQPTLYNFNWVVNREKQEDLDKATSLSLQELKKRMSDSENKSYLVLYDEDGFSIEKVYNAIRKIEDKEDIKCYPSYQEDEPQKQLDDFLKNPCGCLITSHKLIKGSECENGLVIQHAQSTSSNLRGNLMRIVSNLVIINEIIETELIQYNSVMTNNDLLYCISEGEAMMFECLSCANKSNHETKTTKYICTSCKKKCHGQTRQFKTWHVHDEKNKMCTCYVCTN